MENKFIHETSFVDEDVDIGEGTKIWHFSHVLQIPLLDITAILVKML